MIAYTAWDSLQAIAQQYDADLRLDAGTHVALAPRRDRFVRSVPMRRLTERARRSFTMFQSDSESRL